MRVNNSRATAVFCLAAAVVAAAAIDPGVEWMANNGLFGPGQFTDHSNLDVIPALLVGLFFSAAFVAGIVRRFAQVVDTGSIVKLAPAIFVVQLAVLWSMETVEQIVVIGRPMGGTIWLGGPAVVSLALHAAGCLGFTWLLARLLRWSALTIVAVASLIREFFSARKPGRGPRRSRVADISATRFLEPLLARLCGRAPPFLSA